MWQFTKRHDPDEEWEVCMYGSTDEFIKRFFTMGGGAHIEGGCGITKILWFFGHFVPRCGPVLQSTAARLRLRLFFVLHSVLGASVHRRV